MVTTIVFHGTAYTDVKFAQFELSQLNLTDDEREWVDGLAEGLTQEYCPLAEQRRLDGEFAKAEQLAYEATLI